MPQPTPAPPPVTAPAQPEALKVCSALPLTGITAYRKLPSKYQNSFIAALNISGSFEGSSGWGNLSDNFDGQGMSLGLLNQNLGQGTLQPIMIAMRDTSLGLMKQLYSVDQFNSLNGMLNNWQRVKQMSFTSNSLDEGLNEEPISTLDREHQIIEDQSAGVLYTILQANAQSVIWANQNVYTGKRFISSWQTAFIKMAKSTDYVNLQLEAAFKIHNNVLDDMKIFELKEFRSYLFLFDIRVQNGGFYREDYTSYKNWLNKKPNATETERLNSLLQFRLSHVLSQFVNDVDNRKTAIINSEGQVHGEYRILNKEFCYKATESF